MHEHLRYIIPVNVLQTVINFDDCSRISWDRLRGFKCCSPMECTNTTQWRCHTCSCGTMSWRSSCDVAQEFALSKLQGLKVLLADLLDPYDCRNARLHTVVLHTYCTCNCKAPMMSSLIQDDMYCLSMYWICHETAMTHVFDGWENDKRGNKKGWNGFALTSSNVMISAV